MQTVWAFKEWAVVVSALCDGTQRLTLRKGGIAEAGGAFDLPARRFFLFPTFLHQSPDAIRPEERWRFERLERPPEGRVVLPALAEATEVFEVESLEAALELGRETIWTEEAVAKRFRMMPKRPLLAIRLSVRTIPPVSIEDRPEYAGCASWVRLDEPAATEAAKAASVPV